MVEDSRSTTRKLYLLQCIMYRRLKVDLQSSRNCGTCVFRLEADVKRLKADLQSSRNCGTCVFRLEADVKRLEADLQSSRNCGTCVFRLEADVKRLKADLQSSRNCGTCVFRLEADVKRLKADLQSSRNCEHELRSQINNTLVSDKSLKSELCQLRQDNESLQNKYALSRSTIFVLRFSFSSTVTSNVCGISLTCFLLGSMPPFSLCLVYDVSHVVLFLIFGEITNTCCQVELFVV